VFLIAMKFHNVELFFIEHAGELRIFILREEKKSNTTSSPYLGLE